MPGRSPSWYADPDDPALARWHDGTDWTDFTMVIREWTSPEPPPPPAGWSPAPSPTEGLIPAFGARPAPSPPTSAETPAPDDEPDTGAGEPGGAAPAVAPPTAAEPEEPRGLARLASGVPATKAFGAEEPAEEPAPASGVRIDAPTATPAPPETDEPEAGTDADAGEPEVDPGAEGAEHTGDAGDTGDAEEDEDGAVGPISGSVAAIGPEAPGIDWGEGPQALRPQPRPSGWHLDEDGEVSYDEFGDPIPRTLPQRYRASPLWVRIGRPVAVVALIALLTVTVLGGGDGDSTSKLFSQRDGTLDEATLDEKGMDDALTKARENGVPATISDKELAPLVKGVCSAAKRSVVSLSLSQALADTGLAPSELGEAATAIANGSLEYCPDQQGALGQVVTVLVARTQRILATTTTSTSSTTTTTVAAVTSTPTPTP
jgi:hypothetical protein